jgi:hypothetical protein
MDPWTTEWLEGLGQLKNLTTLSGITAATFRHVVVPRAS